MNASESAWFALGAGTVILLVLAVIGVCVWTALQTPAEECPECGCPSPARLTLKARVEGSSLNGQSD